MAQERLNGLDPNKSPTVSFADSLYLSEFSELRTATPGNRADVEFTNDKQPLLVDDISSGNGSATHNANARDVVLAVGGAAEGDTGGMRLHYHVPYTPGSGQEIDITGTLDAAAVGGGTVYSFIRTSISGSTVTTTTEQANWTAATSGVDWSASQIFRLSFQSLKVGRIQFSLVRNGLPVKVHEITNDNVRATGYWQYPSLPFYWSIYNTATETVAEIGYGDATNGIGFMYVYDGVQSGATMRAICATGKSQGGLPLFDMPGFTFATSNKNTAKTVSTTLIPVLSIQVASTINSLTNRSVIIPEAYSLQINNPVRYQILYRPSLTGAAFAAVDATYSGVNVDTTASAVTGGVLIDEDYLSAGNNRVLGEAGLLGRIIMSLGYTGTSDILTLAAIRTGSQDATTYAKIKWREIR